VSDREKVLEAGMNDHIAKPLNLNEMFGTMAKWIKPREVVEAKVLAGGKVVAAEAADAIPELEGIDTKAGLATTMGNAKLYRRLLVKFRDGQGDFAEQFAAARLDSDPSAATRSAHTLKGTAGNIGAKGIQAAAAELEHACKENQHPEMIEELLKKTLVVLLPVIEGLSKLDGQGSIAVSSAATQVDMASMHTDLKRLTELLKDSDSQALELIEELQAKVRGTPLDSDLKAVSKHMADYDFDAALEALKEVRLTQKEMS